MDHMFDGFGLVAKLRIEGGQVYGSHRYIQSKAYQVFKKTGKMAYREFATPIPSDGGFEYAANVFSSVAKIASNSPDFTDNASVNLVPIADNKVMAMSEALSSTYRKVGCCWFLMHFMIALCSGHERGAQLHIQVSALLCFMAALCSSLTVLLASLT